MASTPASICFAFNDQLPTEFECVQNILMHSPGGRPDEENESKLRKRVIERYVTDLRQLWTVAFPTEGHVMEQEQVKRDVHRLLEDHYGKVFRAPVNNKLSNTAKLNVSRKNRTNWRKEHSVLLDLLACNPGELSESDRSFYMDQKIAREMVVSKHARAAKRQDKESDCEAVEEKVEEQVEEVENFLPLEALKMPSPESEVDESAEMAAALIKQIQESIEEEDSELEELIEQAKCKFGIEKGNVSDCGESVIEVKSTEPKQTKGKKNKNKKVLEEVAKTDQAPVSDPPPASSSDQQQDESEKMIEENETSKTSHIAFRPEIAMGIALTVVFAVARAKQLKYF